MVKKEKQNTVKVKQFNLKGIQVGEKEIDLSKVRANPQSLKDYIVAIRNNGRQYTAHTQRRGEMECTKKKPHPQKGQGRSRQGDLVSPQYKGGAVVMGPRTKDIYTRINQKERQAAIRFLLAQKINSGKVCILQNEKLDKPKTKTMVEFLKTSQMEAKRVLLFTNGDLDGALLKSFRNIPGGEFFNVDQINGYEVFKAHKIVFLEDAWNKIVEQRFNEGSK